jgi:ketosteroid isomerase-like protein
MADADDVLQAATARAEALSRGDAQALRSLMHPQLRWTTFRGDVLDRDQYVNGNTNGSLRWHDQRLLDPHVAVVRDTAVLTAVVIDEVTHSGGRETYRLRLTQTWVRQDGKWLCLSGHAGPRLEG